MQNNLATVPFVSNPLPLTFDVYTLSRRVNFPQNEVIAKIKKSPLDGGGEGRRVKPEKSLRVCVCVCVFEGTGRHIGKQIARAASDSR
jgi:hypothetical protein